MSFRPLFFVFFALLAACESPPAPTHPEMSAGGNYRHLSTVPERPEVTVPLYERMQMENELAEANTEAQQAQREAGLAAEPILPVNPPKIPSEVE